MCRDRELLVRHHLRTAIPRTAIPSRGFAKLGGKATNSVGRRRTFWVSARTTVLLSHGRAAIYMGSRRICRLGFTPISAMIAPPTTANRSRNPRHRALRAGGDRGSNFGHAGGDCDSLAWRLSWKGERGRSFQPSRSSGSHGFMPETPVHAELEFSCLSLSLTGLPGDASAMSISAIKIARQIEIVIQDRSPRVAASCRGRPN
jgi:hypothetical protein